MLDQEVVDGCGPLASYSRVNAASSVSVTRPRSVGEAPPAWPTLGRPWWTSPSIRSATDRAMVTAMDSAELDAAERELTSLLLKCESAADRNTLSKGRQTLMDNRVEALRTALQLIADARTAVSTPSEY